MTTRTETFQNKYVPDYLVTPGDVLEEYLEAYEMSQVDLALRTGLARKTINEIIKGKSPITPETALKFELTLGRPAHFWNNLESQYQEDRARFEAMERLQVHCDWLKKFPIKEMVKEGWISKASRAVDQLAELLRFLGVVSPEQWGLVWGKYEVNYRQAQCYEVIPEAVSAWLRMGELKAQEIECAPYDRVRFQEVLEEVRELTLAPPEIFQPKLVELCASAGVAVVFVKELPHTGVSGATRWMGDKAVIQLSLRYKTNDHLWFSFFHEAAHVIKHGRKALFIENDGEESDKENEANEFARNKLIPKAALSRFVSTWNHSNKEIEQFAKSIGIAPGIVVGRLQKDGFLPFSHGNKLKVFFNWN